MSERFPGVDWYCDNCHAYLNDQIGFDDHKYLWKCTECGYKNSLSYANIMTKRPSIGTRMIGYLIGFIRTALLYAIIVSALSLLLGEGFYKEYLIYVLISYFFMLIISMLFEWFVVRYRDRKRFWILRSIIYYLVDDLLRPFKEIFSALLSVLTIFKYKSASRFLFKLVFGVIYAAILGASYYILVLTKVIS